VNREELRTDLEETLNASPAQAHQDFSEAKLNKALNRAYVREVEFAKLVGVKEFFIARKQFTWPVNQQRFEFPLWLRRAQSYKFMDITGGRPGRSLMGTATPVDGLVYFFDEKTLQWGTTGPGSARTIEVIYYGQAADMESDMEEPSIIPAGFHELLVWSAAIQLRLGSDEASPGGWSRAHEDLQAAYQLFVAKGRPRGNSPSVTLPDSSSYSNTLSTGSTDQDGSSIGTSRVTF